MYQGVFEQQLGKSADCLHPDPLYVVFCSQLLRAHANNFITCIFKFDVRISVHRNTDIGVSHQVLQRFRVHAALCHIGAKCMPAHMGRDFGKLNLVSPIILFQCIMKIFFPVKRHFRLPVFVQKQKACFSAYKRFDFWFWPSGNDPGKAIVDLVSHRNITDTTLCLWIFDNLLHLRCALQLMINVDHAGA